VAATDTLATLFSPAFWGLNTPRDLALAGLDLVPPLRRWVARQGTAAGRPMGRLLTTTATTAATMASAEAPS